MLAQQVVDERAQHKYYNSIAYHQRAIELVIMLLLIPIIYNQLTTAPYSHTL